MTIYPIERTENNIVLNKAVKLNAVSKKFPFIKPLGHDGFEEFWALRDVSLEVLEGQILGIIGRNGAGKTTLLNIIAGVLSPTEGEIFVKGRVLGLFNLGVGFQDELTGKDNILLNGAVMGASKKELEAKLHSIIDFSELGDFINMPLGSYSQGMRLRLGFSIIANLDFDILVIDEVLAVGDALFQSKCFQRLMDLKRMGKTLVLSSQSMDLIERFCDRALLLDHGHLLFYGDTLEGINKYRALLNTEKFFVGPPQKNISLFANTKKWAEDISDWGKKLGAKEAIIESVEFINKLGRKCDKIKTKEPLKIKVVFEAKNIINEPHFGIAMFRNDGVYCYGPNTAFDSHEIPKINPGKGWFILSYKQLLFAPGEYRFSVAIWDKNETLAFDYHNGCYKLIIEGYDNRKGAFLNMPFMPSPINCIDWLILLSGRNKCITDLVFLHNNWNQRIESEGIKIESIKLLNFLNEEKSSFMTNTALRFIINFSELKIRNRNSYLWLGIFRDDGIYCQGISIAIRKTKKFKISLPKIPLLPGGYKVSLGIWDIKEKKFLMYYHDACFFRMIFNRQDHGTAYLEHNWEWKLPNLK